MATTGGSSGRAYTPHVCGMLVTSGTMAFYLDNIQVVGKGTTPLSVTNPFAFLIDLAKAGVWPADFKRCGDSD